MSKVKNTTAKVDARALRSFVSAVRNEVSARAKAATAALAYVESGGKQSVLAETAGISTGKVSKHVEAGRCLHLLDRFPDEVSALVEDSGISVDEMVAAVIRCAHGEGGDRKALVDARKADDAASVVTAAFAERVKADESDTDTDESGEGQSAGPVAMTDLPTETIIAWLVENTRLVADRIAGGEVEHVENFVKFSKVTATIAKNLSKMAVAA